MCIRDRLGTLATLVSAEVACITYRLETCTAWLFSGVIRTPTDVGTTSDQVASSRSCIDTSLVRACCEHTHADSLHPAATSPWDGTVSGTCPVPHRGSNDQGAVLLAWPQPIERWTMTV